jgi:hypothetical protein
MTLGTPNFTQNFSKTITEALFKGFAPALSNTSRESVQATVQAQVNAIIQTPVALDTTRPDYEGTLLALMNEIERTASWSEASISGTGQALLRIMATDIAYGQFSIIRALQEANITTALSPMSILMNARALGVRLQRRTPPDVTVNITRVSDTSTILTIPKWSAFTINKVSFFNRDQIVFNENDISLTVVLHQGVVRETTNVSTGAAYQIYEIGNEKDAISDVDVRVILDGTTEWTRSVGSLHTLTGTDKVFIDRTLANNNVELLFGNGFFGASPISNQKVRILWIETMGESAHNATAGQFVEYVNAPANAIVQGLTTTAVANGLNSKDSSYYKLFAPAIRSSNGNAVTRQDYRAVATQYANVYDARFRGQAELNPTKPSWMNIVGATILSDPVMTTAQWVDFEAYMKERDIFQCKFKRLDPTIKTVAIAAKVYCQPLANLESIRQRLITEVTAALKPKIGSLGYSWYKSDLIEILEGQGDLRDIIEFVEMTAPTADVIVDSELQWVKLSSLNLTMAYTKRGDYMGRVI